MTTGIITATKGVLFMKALATAIKLNSTITVATGFFSTRLSAMPMISSTAPVRTNPPITMNMNAIVQGAEFDRTPPASFSGNRPVIIITAAPPTATTSIG